VKTVSPGYYYGENATYLTGMSEGSCIPYLCKFLDEQKNV
jgi:hypothetical protein